MATPSLAGYSEIEEATALLFCIAHFRIWHTLPRIASYGPGGVYARFLMKNAANAPILLLCYNRPRHLRATLAALAANTLAQSSVLYIYADGHHAGEREHSDFVAVRAVIREQRWKDAFEQVEIVEAAANQGLAASVIRGVNEVIGYCGSIIVLEDDVVVSPYFLEFMNMALRLYKADEAVGSIRAHIFDFAFDLDLEGDQKNRPDLFFARMSGDFAWGTWERVWKRVSFDGKDLLARLKRRKLTRAFDYDDCYPYTQMLRDQIAGRNSSWGVRFYASLFLDGMLTLYPGKSLAAHIGYDGGTHFHSKGWSRMDGVVFAGNIAVERLPAEESQDMREKIKQLYRAEGFASLWLLKRIVKAVLPHWLLLRLSWGLSRCSGNKLGGPALPEVVPSAAPKVSFLVAAHNYEKYIKKCIQSVLAQRDAAWDLLIVDDCSSDGTHQICRDYAERDSRIRTVRLEQNLGQYQIINRYSLGLAGQYCCVLDADDYLAPEYMGQMYALAKAGDFDVLLCQHQNIADGTKLFVHDYGAAIGWRGWNRSLLWPLLQLEYFIVDCGTLVKTELRRRVATELPDVALYAATDDVQALFLALRARSIGACRKALYYHNQSSSGTWRNHSEAFRVKKLASAFSCVQIAQELASRELGLSARQAECLPFGENVRRMALRAVAGLSAQQRAELSAKLLEFSRRRQNGLLSAEVLKDWKTRWELQPQLDAASQRTSAKEPEQAATVWTARRIAVERIKEALRQAKGYLPYALLCVFRRRKVLDSSLRHGGEVGFSLPAKGRLPLLWWVLPYRLLCSRLHYQKGKADKSSLSKP